jgi:hypothetical protein
LGSRPLALLLVHRQQQRTDPSELGLATHTWVGQSPWPVL